MSSASSSGEWVLKVATDTLSTPKAASVKIISVRGRSAVVLEFQLNGEKQSLPLKNIRIDPKKKDVLLKHFKKGMDVEVIDEILP